MVRQSISLVTPSFNQAWSLERTIESVLSQGYPRLEYSILDGGSTDGSVEIIKRYAKHLHYWRSHPDRGQTAAVIEGFAASTGDLFGYLNSDDVLMPGALEVVAATLRKEANGWLVGWSRLIDERDDVLVNRPTYPAALGHLWYDRYLLPQEATFFTRNIYETIGGFDASYRYAMDAHAWMKMMSLKTPLYLHEYLGGFRVHSVQKTADMSRYWQEFDRAVADVREWRQLRGLRPDPERPWTSGRTFRPAKAWNYVRHAGPAELLRVRTFQRRYRPTTSPSA